MASNPENRSASAKRYAIEGSMGRPRTILEIGRDVGATATKARRIGAKTVGLVTDAAALADAKARLDEAHLVNLDELGALDPVKGKTFDLVVLGDVLEEVREPEKLLRRVMPLLVDGGHVLVSVPPGTGGEKLERSLRALQDNGYEPMRIDASPQAMHAAAVRFGLEAESTEMPKPVPKGAGNLTISHVLRPIERLVGKHASLLVESERTIVARIPPKPGKLSLTIGMLTLNEQESVEKMIDEIRQYAPDAKIVLIDSSSDKTPELAKAKGAHVIRQLPPRGHGPAMERLMYEAAKDTEALIYLDCDFTYPADTIPKIRALLDSGVDLVNASRTAKYPKAMPVPNFLANRFFAATAYLVHGVPTTDVHSGMRGYRASMVRAFDFDGEGDAIPLDTLIMPARSNYHVVEFPIPYAERVGESKLAKFRGTAWTFIRIAGAVGVGKRVRRGGHYDVRAQQ